MNEREFEFFYGYDNNYINVTNIVYETCIKNDEIIMENINDNHKYTPLFGDPFPGHFKYIKVIHLGKSEQIFENCPQIKLPLSISRKEFNDLQRCTPKYWEYRILSGNCDSFLKRTTTKIHEHGGREEISWFKFNEQKCNFQLN